jgi:hypothetical protein
MSVTYISVELRRQVIARAQHICEYCLILDEDTYLGCQIDHIIGEKHGGPTELENLAHACAACNTGKGSDVGSIDWKTGQFVRFFNPRTDRWSDHFVIAGDRIEPLTPIGAVTARILAFNAIARILERRLLQGVGRYPPAVAGKQL